jgi:hypothetical protein
MDPAFRVGETLLLQHRHPDGTWAAMERMHHGEPEHDAERSWLRRMVFRCACGETVMVTQDDEQGPTVTDR